MTENTDKRPGAGGFLKLALAVFLLWGFTVHAGPALINAIPIWKSMGEISDRLDINAGAIYYTDVPVTREAEMYIQSSLRYQPGKK